ncbi:NAD(P)-binding protein [Parathielavia appendiculata]|uniref:NAD(P)-binding protein n=1 Tax=Parathielavia appendiculata TaxID=2587402 RepID=A0AAN6TQD1_9PEZI|nr:NAD(P)-binding protein [Parathielavia appendiculata]
MTAPTSILIIGAGELGTAILSSLTSYPNYDPSQTTLAVLRRASTLASPDPNTQSELGRLSSQGIVLEGGDFISSPLDDLISIFKKYDVVIQAAGYGTPKGTLLRVAEAVVKAGVKRFFPWQFGIDYQAVADAGEDDRGGLQGSRGLLGSGHEELFGEMLAVRKLLREQDGTEWTVVSTGLFMSFLFLKGFGAVDLKERVLRGLGDWENKVTVTDVHGIGKVVAELMFNPGDTGGKVVYVAGDTVSYWEVANVIEAVYGGEWKREKWDRKFLRRKLEEQPEDLMVKYQNAFGTGIGVSWDKERTVNHQRGIRLTGLREYVEESRERLLQSTQ